MNRVLSIERSQSCSGQSVYVTKRLCISVVFSVGFLCILGGYFLGRLYVDRRASSQRHVLFGELPDKVKMLLNKVENLHKHAVRSNSSIFEANLKNIFGCITLCDNLTMDLNNISNFLETILLHKENELIRSIDTAASYIDSIR